MPEPASVTLALEIDRSEFTKGISDVQRQLKGLAKTQLSFRETWSSLGLSKQLNIGGGVAVGGLDALSSVLRLAGVSDEWTKSLSGAASSARQFGTMLAPLGPLAAGAGTAIGAAIGALKGYTDAHVEAQKRLREIRQSFVDASASEAIAARRATTDEEKAAFVQDSGIIPVDDTIGSLPREIFENIGLESPSILPMVFLKDKDNMIRYASWGYVENPGKVVAAAVKMAGGTV